MTVPRSACDKMRSDLPTGPSGVLRSTWGVIRNPKGLFEKCIAEHGDPFLMTAMNGSVVVTGDPALVEQIFRAPPDTFGVFATKAMTPILGAGSLLLMEGSSHRAARKQIAPPFHGACMRRYGDAMQATAEAVFSRMEPGTTFTGIQVGTEISLDVILKTILGADSKPVLERFRDATRKVLGRSWPILFFSPATQVGFLGMSPMDRLRKAQAELREQLREELMRRGDEIHQRDDILSILARPGDDGQGPDFETLADSVGTLMFAGHETTAVSIAWALYHLLQNPDLLHRLREELDAVDGRAETYATLPLLKAIVQETLRLNPIVTEVLRVARKPFQLGEIEIPIGYSVAAASCLTHYRPEIYPDANAFDPDRFLQRTYSPAEYYPFGGGNRRCIGAAFATYELAIVLGTVLRAYELQLLEDTEVVPKRRNITMGPSTGVRLRFVGRRG
ncbi:MAG: cytochrome P450 [Planctomycetota bacterium]